MSVRLRGSDAAISIRWIPKYTTLERLLHWVHTATFIPLALTGFVLFAPFLEPVAAGEAGMHIRLIHRVAAVFFGGVPIVYALVQPRRMFMNLREFLTTSTTCWLRNAFPYYVLGRQKASSAALQHRRASRPWSWSWAPSPLASPGCPCGS